MEKPVLLYNKENFNDKWLKFFIDFNCLPDLPKEHYNALVRWGNTNGPDNRIHTLNRKKPLKNVLHPINTFNILKLNRIRRPNLISPGPNTSYPIVAKKINLTKEKTYTKIIYNFHQLTHTNADFFFEYIETMKDYRAWVFDAKVFHLEKKIPVESNTITSLQTSQYEPIPINVDADSDRVCQLAVKATHLLGLDFSFVRLAIDLHNRPVLLDINPIFEPTDRIGFKFVTLLKKFLSGTQKAPGNNILLGADPEFVLRNKHTGGLVYPSNFIQKEGLFGYDERSERRQGTLFPLAEVRPDPDICPIRLTYKIKQALQYGLTKIPYHNLEWLAGSIQFGKYQLGGHIHYSGIELSSKLLRALDNYLAIPVMLIENPEAAARRRRNYGGLGNIRLKPHGFEYRTLGSWIISPDITMAILCLAKIIAYEYKNLKKDYFRSYELQKAFFQGETTYFYKVFPILWGDIENTSLYRKYKTEVQLIPHMIEKHENWIEDTDIRKTWNLHIPEKLFNVNEN